MMSIPPSLVRRVPAARAAGTPRFSAPGAPVAARRAPSYDPPALALAVAPRAQARGPEGWVGRTSRRSRAPPAGVGRGVKTRRLPKKPTKQEGKSRSPLTNWPTGSISSAHRDASSQCPDLRSMARRARVAAYDRGKGSRSSRDSAVRWGPRPRSSRRCGATSPSKGRTAGGVGWRGHTPRSARRPPAPSAQPRASPAAPGSRAGTPRGTRRRPSPGAPCRCRGRPGSALRR
jgi:hypothetical protein